jgi:LysM repeat protein
VEAFSLKENTVQNKGKTTNTSSQTYKEYTVVKGDSLWAIAAKLLGSGTRYTEIVKLNNLKSTIIYTGQKLKIPN